MPPSASIPTYDRWRQVGVHFWINSNCAGGAGYVDLTNQTDFLQQYVPSLNATSTGLPTPASSPMPSSIPTSTYPTQFIEKYFCTTFRHHA